VHVNRRPDRARAWCDPLPGAGAAGCALDAKFAATSQVTPSAGESSMASLLKDSRLSTGVLSMRFMQRKAEVELAERLGGGSQESQWRGAGISLPTGAKNAGPTIMYDQRRDTGASRSYSRRSFGNFNTTVEATEATEAGRDSEGPAEETEQPAQKKARRNAPREHEHAPVSEPETSFRAPADAASTRPGENSGGWRRKLEEKKKAAGRSGGDNVDTGTKSDAGNDTVTVGSTKKNKKSKKKKRKMSAT
jgi:hypothetical protein